MNKPVLFWDFHGTLSQPDITWFDAALYAIAKAVPEQSITREALEREFHFTCLPWYEIPSLDTREVAGSRRWWQYSERNFAAMLVRCGLTKQAAQLCAPLLREYILDPASYRLYPDAIPVLAELQKCGYASYMLSNNFPELADVAKGLGLGPYFAGYVISGEVGYEKPHRGIFEAALAMAGSPQSPWMIGDNPVDDIEGAAAMGFTTVAVYRPSPKATYNIQQLDELLQILQ